MICSLTAFWVWKTRVFWLIFSYERRLKDLNGNRANKHLSAYSVTGSELSSFLGILLLILTTIL